MKIDRDLVDYVAALARLRLDDSERDAMVEQLGRIVEYVELLGEVDVDDVPPTKHVIDLADVERADEPRPSLPRDEALANAPDVDEGHFVVPRVLPE